jgi:predicted outer membrane repeat protein
MCFVNEKRIVVGLFIVILALALPSISRADVIIVSGDVAGTWSADTILVVDSIYVSPGNSLTIEPGVDVVFLYASYFRVHDGATLHAVGTETDSIKFVPLNEGYNTLGIIFINSSSESILEYCYFKRASYSAIQLHNSIITIRNCLFENNRAYGGYSKGGAIATFNGSDALIENNTMRDNISDGLGGAICCVASSPIIRNNEILDNQAGPAADSKGGAIACYNQSQPMIIGNDFIGNEVFPSSTFPGGTLGQGGAIYCDDESSPYIGGNLFLDNYVHPGHDSGRSGGGAIFVFSASPTIENNVFAGNTTEGYLDRGGAIYLFNSNSIMTNNTFTNNTATVMGGAIYTDLSAFPLVTNSILYNNTAANAPEIGFDNSTPTVTYSDVAGGWYGDGNINLDPLFRDPASNDYHLMAIECEGLADSPCIDAGDPAIDDIELSCDRGLGTIRSDMGAYGGGDSSFVGISNPESSLPNQFSLIQNYPNPFNASTTIKYELPQQTNVTIDIHDILGRRVATLFGGVQPAGEHRAIWDASAFTTGVYFARLEASGKSKTIRMILLK